MLGAIDLFNDSLQQPCLGVSLHEDFLAEFGPPALLTVPLSDDRAFDWSSNFNHGALNGGITTTPGGFGTLGAAWGGFNASSRYISTTYSGVLGTAARWVAVVFSTTSTTGAGTNSLISWGDNTGLTAGTIWDVDVENGVIWLRCGSGVTASWGSGYNDGKFHLLVLTMKSGAPCNQIECSVDGVPLSGTFANGTTAINTASSAAVQIGRMTTNNNYFAGSVALAAIGGSYLLSGTRSQLYNCLFTGEPFPLFQPSLTRRHFPVSAGGPQSVTVPPVDVAVSAVAPPITLGPVSQGAGIANVALSAIAPTISLGPVSPAVPTINVPVSVAAPSISLGPVSPAAGIASIVVSAAPPTIALGGVAASVPAINVAVDAIAPNVENGAIFAAAGVASVAVDANPPAISLGPVLIAAPIVSVAIDANPPAINLGSVSVAAGVADVLVDVVSPFTQPPQSADAGILDVAAAVIAPAAGYASYPTIDVWQLDARPTVWILEP